MQAYKLQGKVLGKICMFEYRNFEFCILLALPLQDLLVFA